MQRDLIFLAGEWQVSAALAYRRDRWAHTNVARLLDENPDGTFHRRNVHERLRGLIYYADVSDPTIRRSNLEMLARQGFPCWPDPKFMLEFDDRHIVHRRCLASGFGTHDVFVGTRDKFHRHELPWRFVLKVGNEHRGEGKLLLDAYRDVTPDWEGLATAEPFFEGSSVRVLLIQDEVIGLRFDNPGTWIKNDVGADVDEIPLSQSDPIVKHARGLQELFGADICGIDYIVLADGTFRFLEYNHFPGVGSCERAQRAAARLFEAKMDEIEDRVADFAQNR